jgi:peptide subunit release factor 1 (eRF1)
VSTAKKVCNRPSPSVDPDEPKSEYMSRRNRHRYSGKAKNCKSGSIRKRRRKQKHRKIARVLSEGHVLPIKVGKYCCSIPVR